MLIRAPNDSYESIDFRETAPAAASQNMYAGNINASKYGGLAWLTINSHTRRVRANEGQWSSRRVART